MDTLDRGFSWGYQYSGTMNCENYQQFSSPKNHILCFLRFWKLSPGLVMIFLELGESVDMEGKRTPPPDKVMSEKGYSNPFVQYRVQIQYIQL